MDLAKFPKAICMQVHNAAMAVSSRLAQERQLRIGVKAGPRRRSAYSIVIFPRYSAIFSPCSAHTTGNGVSSPAMVMPTGWRPSRIASMISGASSVSRSTRPT